MGCGLHSVLAGTILSHARAGALLAALLTCGTPAMVAPAKATPLCGLVFTGLSDVLNVCQLSTGIDIGPRLISDGGEASGFPSISYPLCRGSF